MTAPQKYIIRLYKAFNTLCRRDFAALSLFWWQVVSLGHVVASAKTTAAMMAPSLKALLVIS
jgi:hypothetical protein